MRCEPPAPSPRSISRHATPRVPASALLLVPLAVGALVMVRGGAPAARWGLHLGAGAIGLAAHAGVAALPRRVVERISLPGAAVGVGLVASTLFGAGIDGVRRWHELGPVRLHISALLAPLLLVFAAARMRSRPAVAHGVLVSLQVVHLLQPDAGQATALGAGAIVCALALGAGPLRYLWGAAYGASIAGAWLRPDPLLPAPFVEDIVGRAFALSPALGVLAVLSTVAIVAAPWAASRKEGSLAGHAGPAVPVALMACFAGSLIAPVFGELPVPLLGFGPSPVLGAFVGIAALRRSLDERAARAGQ